jgi:hypothetical protein
MTKHIIFKKEVQEYFIRLCLYTLHFFNHNICLFCTLLCKNILQLQGKIVAPPKEAWKDASYWISMQYINGLTIDGTNTGAIDGYGSTWWQCKSCSRPIVLFYTLC